MISRSRSTSSRTATLCTRPADSDGRTFFHSTGDSSKPTRRSSTRRACWALTRFMSDRPRVLDSLQNGPLRNFVEDDPLRPLDRETQHFGQVPCDGLSFAVFIGGEPHSPVLRGAREFVHDLAFILRDLVDRREPVGEIDSQILFREVANMAEARLDHEILTQELLDRLGLGRRLDDN